MSRPRMSEWRSHAKAGRRDLIDWANDWSVPKKDWPKLLMILQIVVPKIERRDGLEYRQVHAGPDDREALRDWVDCGKYAAFLPQVQDMLRRTSATAPSEAKQLSIREGGAGRAEPTNDPHSATWGGYSRGPHRDAGGGKAMAYSR
jgi:hypothetical protein